MKNDRKPILDLNIDLYSYKEALDSFVQTAKKKESTYACFANVHMLMEAHKDPLFAKQVNDAAFVMPDGMPIVKALGSFYGLKQDRVAGMDVFPDLLKLCAQHELNVFFYGTTSDVLEKIITKAKAENSKLKVAGSLAPPFSRSVDDEDYISMIKNSGAHMVFVALGCPKQEKWMATHSKKINSLLLGVGGAFSIYAGTAKRAPQWMRQLSLEWLYRFFQEPGRLFTRYLTTNTLFIYLFAKEKLKNRS
jgi:N-acetylglucosaminyldiphosphoundecaprenol N-acetyl-beta-D-mannosaminyltransferase